MNVMKCLTADLVEVPLAGDNKRAVIENMLNLAMRSGRIRDRGKALDCLLKRERQMSTGMQCGIAIPHCKTDQVDTLVACIGIKPEGVDFDALDREPSTIFVMTISPINQIGPHVQFLAEISKLLRLESVRQALLAAATPEAVLAILGVPT